MNYSFGEADKHPKNIELANERQLNIAEEAEHRYRNIGFPEIYTKEDIVQVFRDGANWADENPKNIWHNVSEEPNKDSYIIIEINDENSGPLYEALTTNDADDEFWEYLTSEEDITRWAYINDLLPKNKNK